MIELALDPAWVALGGSIAGGMVLKAVENRAKRKKGKAVRKRDGHMGDLEAMTDSFACTVYEARVFEKKLVDAGIMTSTEMSLCEDKNCSNCHPTRKEIARKEQHELAEKNRANMVKARNERALFYENVSKNESEWEAFQRLKRTDPRYKGYTYSDYKFQQSMKRRARAEVVAKPVSDHKPVTTLSKCKVCGQLTERDSMCLPCRQEAAQKRDAELIKRNAQHMHGRWTEIGGMRILRPNNVPSFATAKSYYDPNYMCDYILWTWSYPDTGTFSFKQRVAIDEYESQNANGEVIARWQSVHDPVTGEHLGDVKVNPNGKTELRDAPKCRDAAAHQLTGDCGCDWDKAKRQRETSKILDDLLDELSRLGQVPTMIMTRKSTGDLGPM